MFLWLQVRIGKSHLAIAIDDISRSVAPSGLVCPKAQRNVIALDQVLDAVATGNWPAQCLAENSRN